MSLTVDGKEREINADFRDIINIFLALSDPDVKENEKCLLMVCLLYKDNSFINFKTISEAVKQASWFMDCGKDWGETENKPQLLDWEQDFNMIVSAADKNIKTAETCLELPFLHWWTFISKFTERGESQMTTVLSIREKLSKGQKLEKYEKEILKDNRDLIIIKKKIDVWGDW